MLCSPTEIFKFQNLEQFNRFCIPELPQNDHHPRSDVAVPLDLRQVAKLAPMLSGQVDDQSKAVALNGAAKFYHQALQNCESDPEIAYLHLITAGEILTNAHRPESVDYLDETIQEILKSDTALCARRRSCGEYLSRSTPAN